LKATAYVEEDVIFNISAEASETRPDAKEEVAENEHAFVAQDIAHAA